MQVGIQYQPMVGSWYSFMANATFSSSRFVRISNRRGRSFALIPENSISKQENVKGIGLELEVRFSYWLNWFIFINYIKKIFCLFRWLLVFLHILDAFLSLQVDLQVVTVFFHERISPMPYRPALFKFNPNWTLMVTRSDRFFLEKSKFGFLHTWWVMTH